LEKLSARGLLRGTRAILAALAAGAVLTAILSLPWRPARPAERPRITALARGGGPLAAGAAEVPFDPPLWAPIAGYPRLVFDSTGIRDPVGVRAVVLSTEGCTVALVSAELLLVPAALTDAVRERIADLRLDGLVVAATHSHASVGGYWDHLVGERIATGPFDRTLFDGIAERIAFAIRAAAEARAPARIGFGFAEHDELARNRAGSAEVDGRLNVVRIASTDGDPIAELVFFAAHPTLLGKDNHELSGDWPGRLMAARDRNGVRLLFQGAVGDQSTRLPSRGRYGVEEYGGTVSHTVNTIAVGAPVRTVPLAWAEARIVLPEVSLGAVPALLRPAARNVLGGVMPAHARVGALAVGPLTLLVVPAEPVAAVGDLWRGQAGEGAEILSVAGDYLGYVELSERMAGRRGETRRTYYGPELAGRLGVGLAAVTDAVRNSALPEPVEGPAPSAVPAVVGVR
jgi:neutral ceramidase